MKLWSPETVSDEKFISVLYNVLLGRDPDPDGLSGKLSQIASGATRDSMFLQTAHSAECQSRIESFRKAPSQLPNLVAKRPDRYSRSGEFLVFDAAEKGDFDWLERSILDYGFYERPGPWGYGIDQDKAVLASLIASLGVTEVFELGCGDGGTLVCAEHLGVAASGLDISAHAKSFAQPGVQKKIILGDLLDCGELTNVYAICAFDLIEHISPNKIDRYLFKVQSLLNDGGLAIFNTPAFGNDQSSASSTAIGSTNGKVTATAQRSGIAFHVMKWASR